jgi:hypothetical protein
MLIGSQHSGGRGACKSSGMGTRMSDKSVNTRTYKNQTISWLVHNWTTFGAWTSHGQTWTHKTHHGSNLGEATTFPLIVFSMPSHEASTQMSFCPETCKLGVPKFSKLGLLQLWKLITSFSNL